MWTTARIGPWHQIQTTIPWPPMHHDKLFITYFLTLTPITHRCLWALSFGSILSCWPCDLPLSVYIYSMTGVIWSWDHPPCYTPCYVLNGHFIFAKYDSCGLYFWQYGILPFSHYIFCIECDVALMGPIHHSNHIFLSCYKASMHSPDTVNVTHILQNGLCRAQWVFTKHC